MMTEMTRWRIRPAAPIMEPFIISTPNIMKHKMAQRTAYIKASNVIGASVWIRSSYMASMIFAWISTPCIFE